MNGLFLAGISHKTAPVGARERLAFSGDELPEALSRLHCELGKGVILSTCNRTELYLDAPGGCDMRTEALAFLARAKGLPEPPPEERFYFLQRQEAVRHLFRVAAGVDSMVVGEAEILGQVRSAFVAAVEAGCNDPYLSRLFHSAIRVGRRARAETSIGRNVVSVSSLAVRLAKKTLGDLASLSVLVISAGEAGKLAASALRENGASRIFVTSRTLERARRLAADLGGQALPFSRLPSALAESDIVISSTGAPSFLIQPETVKEAMVRRDGRSLLFIDIAVPRDVHPSVREIEGVHLYDIDDLQAAAEANLRSRLKEVAKVEAMVEEEANRFGDWARSLRALPTVAAIRKQAEAVRQAELARTFARLPGLSDEERARIEALSAAIVKKLLHRPIARLKAKEYGHLYVQAARELFGIDDEGGRDS
ncbi:MAG: glutamyl-tRNA reductase [Dehalococcoidia bacterium]|nr:glutamyl-tRNA reductase [Dehalococcoidia bacterium]